MSMDELAKRSGVSKSMLSQIEQEKTNPTVVTVWKISKALNVSIEDLLKTVCTPKIEVLRQNEAPVLYSEDKLCMIKVNTPIHMTDNLEIYNIIFKPGGKLDSTPHFPNAEEIFTVISGRFIITSGKNSSILNKGDTGRYKADRNHCIKNISPVKAEGYLVVWFPKNT